MGHNINSAGPEIAGDRWIRSSRCNPSGNCVETNRGPAVVSVRDSKAGSAATLTFERASWSTFVTSCRSAC
ncbi:MAG: DUF397 domain-containing protein [Labedaea sp.]